MPTYTDLREGFQLGPWEVLPDRGLLRNGDVEKHLEPKVFDVLVVLAAQQGQVVSKDQLIESVWDGRAQGDEPLNRCIHLLRKGLGDETKNPIYVETIQRRGYRLKMPITLPEKLGDEGDGKASGVRWPYWLAWAVGAGVMVVVYFLVVPPDPARLSSPMTSVAVFPFQCPGNTDKSLCFGFSAELTSTLLHAAGIKVVKSRSFFPDEDSYQQVAELLGVEGLLTGSVQQMGDQVKISAQLVDGRSGFVVLSDTLDGSVEDIFRLQEQVASIIEKSLNGGESGRPLHSASEPSSFEAFQAYARGQYEFQVRDRGSIEKSIQLFEESIRLDPLFGPAYLRLAYAYLLLPDVDPSIDAESMYELALATVNAGIKADSTILQPAGAVFGFVHHKRGEWLQATKAFERAVTADTVYPMSHHWYSRLLASVGRMDDALYQAERAHELDPDSAIIISRLAITNFGMGNLEMAQRYFDVVNKMTLESSFHDVGYALFLIRKEQFDDAGIVTKRGLEKLGLNTEWVDPVFAGVAHSNMRETAAEYVRQLATQGILPRYIPMTLWALLGDADSSMQVALTIENPGQSLESEVLFLDEFKDVRAHQDIPKLLEIIGLPSYWAEVGCEWIGGAVVCSPSNK